MEIKELRAKLKLTQAAFAKLVGVDVITVSRWERHKATPSRLAQEKLAHVLSLCKE